jgi:hypothetical protein
MRAKTTPAPTKTTIKAPPHTKPAKAPVEEAEGAAPADPTAVRRHHNFRSPRRDAGVALSAA